MGDGKSLARRVATILEDTLLCLWLRMKQGAATQRNCTSLANLKAKLTHAAIEQGRNPDDPVEEVLTRYFEPPPVLVDGNILYRLGQPAFSPLQKTGFAFARLKTEL